MADRFLLVRLGSLGDIIFALPVAAALRDTFPRAQIDWLVDRRWRALLESNPDVSERIELASRSVAAFLSCATQLRSRRYDCAVDIQALYKSAVLARLSGAAERIGFTRTFVREPGAEWLYTKRVTPESPHMVEQNLTLARAAGAHNTKPRFPLHVSADARELAKHRLHQIGFNEYGVMSLGGGWRSKCWPPERFGELARRFHERWGIRLVLNYGPGEEQLARDAMEVAGPRATEAVQFDLSELIALLERARVVIAADSGPLHLAVALGTPVVGLFGPTKPERNGPYNPNDIVVRKASDADTTYKRRHEYSSAMLRITVDDALEAVEKRLRFSSPQPPASPETAPNRASSGPSQTSRSDS